MPSAKPVLLLFLPPMSQPMLREQLKTFRNRLGERIRVIELEASQHPMIFQSFQVEALPALVLLQAGVECWRQEGISYQDAAVLLRRL